jgi:hypothetical protein
MGALIPVPKAGTSAARTRIDNIVLLSLPAVVGPVKQ